MRELNKKNVLLIVASITVIGGAFMLAEYGNSNSTSTVEIGTEILANNAFAESLSSTDSDNDGLKDWEEELWGMDPLNRDSNNNGMNDGDEVTRKIINNEQHLASSAVTSSIVRKGTQTEEFSKRFFTNYLELRRGGNLNDFTINDLTSRLAESVTTTGSDKPKYSSTDIKIVTSDTADELRKYANTFAAIRERYQKTYAANPLSVTDAGPNFEDPQFLKSIARASDLYKNILPELLALPVPQSIVPLHINLLNTYTESAQGLYEVSTITKDPIIAMKGIGRHHEASVLEEQTLKQIADQLYRAGVFFTSTEPGYFFESYKQ